MRITLTLALGSFLAIPAHSADLNVGVEIPVLQVAEYHRPYIAVWLENQDQQVAANLAIWYLQNGVGSAKGVQWLPDLRQWWRKSGRALQLPIDGITGPTRPAGTHALHFTDAHPQLATLPPGQYQMVVEAVREVGGRELIKLPFTWPIQQASAAEAQGMRELGTISLTLTP